MLRGNLCLVSLNQLEDAAWLFQWLEKPPMQHYKAPGSANSWRNWFPLASFAPWFQLKTYPQLQSLSLTYTLYYTVYVIFICICILYVYITLSMLNYKFNCIFLCRGGLHVFHNNSSFCLSGLRIPKHLEPLKGYFQPLSHWDLSTRTRKLNLTNKI